MFLKAYDYVKEFGEGIDRICSELESRGCAIPTFHLETFILKTTLKAEWTDEKDVTKHVTNDVTKESYDKLSDRQKEIIRILMTEGEYDVTKNVTKNVTKTIAGLAKHFKVSERTIKRDMEALSNIVRHIGSSYGGYWEIKGFVESYDSEKTV